MRAVERDIVEFFILQEQVFALGEFEAFHAIVRLDRVTGFRIHDLVTDAVASLAVDDVEADAFRGRCCGK